VAYDNSTSYPFWWYLRNYKNALFFGEAPSRELFNYPVVLAGQNNYARVDAFLRDRYYSFEYERLWWPMQDYFNLTWERIWTAVSDPQYRQALWDIWFHRDYDAYGVLVGREFSPERWDPAERMRLYIRKDTAALIWTVGVPAESFEPLPIEDPYEAAMFSLAADRILGGIEPVTLDAPRGLAVGLDGSVYIADSRNHRIVHLAVDGSLLGTWGGFADLAQGEAAGGMFNEPWDVTVAPDGSVFVADTWNHRVQHFTSSGEWIGMFGRLGQAETLDAMWGPRAVLVDEQGRVFVADTGNKRIVIFTADGQPLAEIGGGGIGPGQLDEPVGLAMDDQGRLVVADTWNQRMQVFEEIGQNSFQAVLEWPIDGWYGQSLDNKPFLAAGPLGQICTTDPEGQRVLCFTGEGEFIKGWSWQSGGGQSFGLTSGITFDGACGVWVSDSALGQILHFEPELCP
jgi:sugar lactone lactonase YvrE